MNKSILIGMALAGVVLLGGAAYFFSQNSGSKQPEAALKTDTASQTNKPADAIAESAGEAMKKIGSYKEYSPETVTAEQQAGNKVVLFFHAPWCPFCKAADAAFKVSLDKIPAGVTVLKTDYDSNTELKKKYSVTYQHTFIQIDASGNMVSKWNGGDTEMLIKNIK
jgi:thioredoxin 1